MAANPHRHSDEGVTFPTGTHAKQTVLIAEDNADSREVMQLLLEKKGCEVVSAHDGPSAIQLALQSRPDVVLIDLELPKLDGLSVARELRRRSELRGARIVIVSGHDPADYRQEALEAGCDDYFLKPINFDKLHELLHRDGRQNARAQHAAKLA